MADSRWKGEIFAVPLGSLDAVYVVAFEQEFRQSQHQVFLTGGYPSSPLLIQITADFHLGSSNLLGRLKVGTRFVEISKPVTCRGASSLSLLSYPRHSSSTT